MYIKYGIIYFLFELNIYTNFTAIVYNNNNNNILIFLFIALLVFQVFFKYIFAKLYVDVK